MRVASLESVLTAATLVLAIVIVLWGIKIFHGVWAGVLASNWKPPIKKRFATKASLPRRRRPFHFELPTHRSPEVYPFRRVPSLVYGLPQIRHRPRKALVSSPACILVIIWWSQRSFSWGWKFFTRFINWPRFF